MNFLQKIGAVILGIFSLFGAHQMSAVQQSPTLGASFAPTGGGTYRLQSSVGTANTTIPLSSFKEPISNTPYTMTYLGSNIEYGTLDPQQPTRSEFISFTGITQNSDGTALLTGVTRGLSRSAPYTNASSTIFAQSHAGQSIFILSDAPGLFNQYAIKANNETITGQWTFSSFPITPSSTMASTSAAGGVQMATAAQAAAGTDLGSTGYHLALGSNLAKSTRTASTSQVVVSNSTDGYLDLSYINPSANFASTTTFGGTQPFLFNKQVFYTSSTFSVPSGVKKIWVRVVGGGAGGGNGGNTNNDNAAGGGGGGGYAESWCDVSATTTINATVATSVTATSNGNTSSFGNCATATGGTAGTSAANVLFATGGPGGVGTIGDIKAGGQPGGPGLSLSTSQALISGFGGGSLFGQGGVGVSSGGGVPAVAATSTYGFGGGGSGANQNSTGGQGNQGLIILNW